MSNRKQTDASRGIVHKPLPLARPRGQWDPEPLRIPLQPLLDCMSGTDVAKACRLSIGHRQFIRFKQTGVTIAQADELAIRVQIHPTEIWDDWERFPVQPDSGLACAG